MIHLQSMTEAVDNTDNEVLLAVRYPSLNWCNGSSGISLVGVKATPRGPNHSDKLEKRWETKEKMHPSPLQTFAKHENWQ